MFHVSLGHKVKPPKKSEFFYRWSFVLFRHNTADHNTKLTRKCPFCQESLAIIITFKTDSPSVSAFRWKLKETRYNLVLRFRGPFSARRTKELQCTPLGRVFALVFCMRTCITTIHWRRTSDSQLACFVSLSFISPNELWFSIEEMREILAKH